MELVDYWLGNAHAGLGNLKAAIESYELAVASGTDLFYTLWFLVLAQYAVGDFDGAACTRDRIAATLGSDSFLLDVAAINALARQGRTDSARTLLEQRHERLPAIALAHSHFLVGEWEHGIGHLHESHQNGLNYFTRLYNAVHPGFESRLCEYPAYIGLLESMGVDDEHTEKLSRRAKELADELGIPIS